jgi:hypothetical protein
MSSTRRKSQRRSHATPATVAPAAAPQAQPATPWEPTPLPEWHWRTLPVFFAFSLGGFIGLELGIIAGNSGSNGPALGISVIFALMLGLAFSRFAVRLMISRRWVKPRPRPQKRR